MVGYRMYCMYCMYWRRGEGEGEGEVLEGDEGLGRHCTYSQRRRRDERC